MVEKGLQIRTATAEDAPALAAIYAPYVRDTAITFEYEPPTAEEFAVRMRKTLTFYPYLVAVLDGEPVGYAYASPFKDRPAYDWAVETSIYVTREHEHEGIGRKLHDALANCLRAQGICNMYACIALPDGPDDETLTRNSEQFHAHLGYRLVGEFYRCGYKTGRWYNMVWMEYMIGEHVDAARGGQPAVRPFAEVRAQLVEQGALYE